ncbi:alpha-mannosidase [Cohnella abietis]|uniref:Alpha-mannosidase n=1 Tax=Cohnella abietis TaxID=2507935 RepID=A0A3T1DBH1_9BACL|nr:alpha-mannosidase [Cohnella abietis]BBI35394.1 alpha-mannosidase [Cohnella abietis]
MFKTLEKITSRIQELAEYRYRDSFHIPSFLMQPDPEGKVGEAPPQSGEWEKIPVGSRWSGYDVYVWLKSDVEIPLSWAGRRIVGRFNFGRSFVANIGGFESLLYLNGSPYQGVDTNHEEVFFPETAAGQTISLCFRLWSGLENHEPILLQDWSVLGPIRKQLHTMPERPVYHGIQEHTLSRAELCCLDEATDDLYYLGRAATETIELLPQNDPTRQSLLASLNRAFERIDWSRPGSLGFYESVAIAQGILQDEIDAIPKNSPVTVTCIGHTHIDVAWLWQLKHTREKSARSFSTVMRLMEQFPEFAFLQTQPQLYDYIKSDYPEIYSLIKERVKEGRWEVDGGMWLEADCNITSGEALVRQLLLGTRFIQDEFGVTCKYLWLPDVFGYSWALPQILKKSGIDSFMTCKINMANQYNEMPHHTFQWRGIDGSEVLTHFPGHNYNGVINASSIHDLWDRYRNKELNRNLLFAYGYGDGGGGVNREMLEFRRRLDKMPGMPNVETGRVDEYFDRLQETVRTSDQYVHTWEGELYFENHRGTYTSQAFVKLMNRRCELGLREAEWQNVLSCAVQRDWSNYPAGTLHEAWKIVLRNQFHDILPGSSIQEVYDDCRVEYAEAENLILQATNQAEANFHSSNERNALAVYNGASWTRSDLAAVPLSVNSHSTGTWKDGQGRLLEAQWTESGWLIYAEAIPSLGYSKIQWEDTPSEAERLVPFASTESGIVTPFYELEWNEQGQLIRIFDRSTEREVLLKGARGNVFQVFEDKPLYSDAWDIDIFYKEKMREISELRKVSVIELGALRAVVRFEWGYMDSTIEQDLIIYAHSRRIDFATRVDWQETQQLLKSAFAVDIKSTEATYDIQFGNVKRPTHWNTSWDYARFETVGHQWADLSEQGYGVSLLNDCKYGYDIKGNLMRLSLLKSGLYPDSSADKGKHEFTYSLYPHEHSWYEGATVQEAWCLNNPISVRKDSPIQVEASLFQLSADNLLIDAVKKAEDSEAIIVRYHEFAGARGHIELTSGLKIASWQECDLLERPIGEITLGATVRAMVMPYEIKTYRIELE